MTPWDAQRSCQDELDEVMTERDRYRKALEDVVWMLDPESEVIGVDPADAYRALGVAREALASLTSHPSEEGHDGE